MVNDQLCLFRARMSNYGVAPEHIQIVDITVQNGAKQAENPDLVAQIRECTAIFFGGGDQTRITRALRRPDGTSTAALQAIYDARDKGRNIAGTSAGAAVQSEAMITVSGFPDGSIDDGRDPLDFGLTKAIEQPAQRGLLVSRGLGFLNDAVFAAHHEQLLTQSPEGPLYRQSGVSRPAGRGLCLLISLNRNMQKNNYVDHIGFRNRAWGAQR